MGEYEMLIAELLADPEKLKLKKPFTRGYTPLGGLEVKEIAANEMVTAHLPSYRRETVTQEQFLMELDPSSHSCLYDDNIPSICVKTKNGGYSNIEFKKMSVPFQKNIKNKVRLHLTGNPMQFTLSEQNPTETQKNNYTLFKQYWELRNQDGMKDKMVDAQLSTGDAGLLYYFDYKGQIKSRILSFEDGYVLCPHNDKNGDRILESVYYCKDNVEYIDSYDDQYMYRHKLDNTNDETSKNGWVMETPVRHGFNEIPLITKRGEVPWNDVQNIIESYEILYNVFNAIQRRHGWGLLYIKGRLKETAQKLAGSVVLNDTTIDGKGDAKFLTPPTPQGTIDTLQLMLDTIQLGSSTTFLLPKDIKTNGDVSGLAIQLTQSLDIENARKRVIDWQNVADKMVRLFKYGLAVELVKTGKNKTAITDFEDLNINAKFKIWQPRNDYEYNQMLTLLTGAGLLSKETGIQKNTESAPDELARKEREDELAEEKAAQLAAQQNVINNNQNKAKEE